MELHASSIPNSRRQYQIPDHSKPPAACSSPILPNWEALDETVQSLLSGPALIQASEYSAAFCTMFRAPHLKRDNP